MEGRSGSALVLLQSGTMVIKSLPPPERYQFHQHQFKFRQRHNHHNQPQHRGEKGMGGGWLALGGDVSGHSYQLVECREPQQTLSDRARQWPPCRPMKHAGRNAKRITRKFQYLVVTLNVNLLPQTDTHRTAKSHSPNHAEHSTIRPNRCQAT